MNCIVLRRSASVIAGLSLALSLAACGDDSESEPAARSDRNR